MSINPPGFAWWRAPGASDYLFLLRDATGKLVYEASGLKDPVHLPTCTLGPGEYAWDVQARDPAGEPVARRGWWRFSVPPGLPELPWEDPRAIMARVPDTHPRLVFSKQNLPAIRKSFHAGRWRAAESVKASAELALKTPLPRPPGYDTLETRARRLMGYQIYFVEFRRCIDDALNPLSLAYLLSGDERYGLAAKRILLEVENWGVDGLMSVLSPYGDEPGLAMAKRGHQAYDWLHDLFDESERTRVRRMTIARARQVMNRLRRSDYLACPAESHEGRLIAYLLEYAIALKGEAEDATEWLDYSLRALLTFYPHWGDSDGGWAEGVSYATGYNRLYLAAIEALRVAAEVDLYKRPFFGNVRRFFMYCAAPRGEIRPFGDGAEEAGLGGAVPTMLHHGRRLGDGTAVWWANQVEANTASTGDPLVALLSEDTVQPVPPAHLPSAAVFRGIGWVALHSALDRPDEDTFFLFKSSPYGSVSHSHADQNSFCVLKGGRALAIASGYYGPSYGMPHHASWTRQTKANNCVLVNGEGQLDRALNAIGRITEFRHQKALTYTCGDAAAAYGGKVSAFLRHVLFLRPGVFALLDELWVPEPAQFQWLLHALEKMEIDAASQTVVSKRKGASLSVQLDCCAGLSFSQTDQFDTPYNKENPPEHHQNKANHWHFTASTTNRTAQTRIAALMVVRGQDENLTVMWKRAAGWLGVMVETASGRGEAWVQSNPDAVGPQQFGRARLAGIWIPVKGEKESLIVT